VAEAICPVCGNKIHSYPRVSLHTVAEIHKALTHGGKIPEEFAAKWAVFHVSLSNNCGVK